MTAPPGLFLSDRALSRETQVDGVPTVYYQLKAELSQRLARMRNAGRDTVVGEIAKRMFWRKSNEKMTGFGNLAMAIVTGVGVLHCACLPLLF